MADVFGTARTQDAATVALVLTQSDAEMVSALLQKRGFTENDFLIKKVSPVEIPLYLSASDIAISFIKACYSKLSSSPTKIAEYLASGIPIITNRGVGDVAEMIEKNRVGAVIEDFTPYSYLKALKKVAEMKDLNKKCRQTAEREFDLEKVGGAKYRLLYSKLLNKSYVEKKSKNIKLK